MLPYVLHETDLFRPHEDPDDHYDLACQFALAKMGRIRLAGVLIDWPPSPGYGDPDVLAAAQMNQLTGQCAPVGVGCPPGESGGTGEALLRRTLEDAPEPVTLHIVGSSRDVARFGRENPELFRKKVRAIYLNAGSGTDSGRLEYNVALDPKAYAEIFRLPCAIYWMPCFHSVFAPGGEMEVGEYGTFYRFRQADVFDRISPRLLNYFLNVLARRESSRWLSCLDAPVDPRLRAHFGAMERNMWCTGGFLHAAGLTVHLDGSLAPLGEAPQREVFEFVPAAVQCDDDGRCSWEPRAGSDRFIFRVRDERAYPAAMTAALGELLRQL